MEKIDYADAKFRRACRMKIDKPDPPYKPALPDKEFERFMFEAEARGLNPLLGHLWAQYRKGRWSYETTIDGLRFIAGNTGELAGEDPTEFSCVEGAFVSATVTIYRWQHGQRCPYTATAFYDEYVQRKKDGKPVKMWVSMPRSQTAKCAGALALRKGFPEMGQIYTSDEMAQADNPTATPPPKAPSGTKPPSAPPDSPAGPSPVDAAQSTERPDNGQPDDSAERRRLVAAFSGLAVVLGFKNAELSTAICKMAGLKTLQDADLALIDSKVQLLQKMDVDEAKERVRKLLDKPTQDSQVSAVEALATLQQALGSGKPIFEHLERKFGTRAVNATTTPEILRLAALPVAELQGALVDEDIPY